MNKEEFIKLTGEDPVDVLGQDWENEIEDFLSTPNTKEEKEKEREGREVKVGRGSIQAQDRIG